jgi:hypothetical protein
MLDVIHEDLNQHMSLDDEENTLNTDNEASKFWKSYS